MRKILVLCTGNSCRSQMTEGYLRHFSNSNFVEIYSAGIETHGLNPQAVAIMQEDGIDISTHTSNHIDEYKSICFDFVITVCDHAKESCPVFSGNGQRFHHNFSDPSKATGNPQEVLNQFRMTRDAIKEYTRSFATNYL